MAILPKNPIKVKCPQCGELFYYRFGSDMISMVAPEPCLRCRVKNMLKDVMKELK